MTTGEIILSVALTIMCAAAGSFLGLWQVVAGRLSAWEAFDAKFHGGAARYIADLEEDQRQSRVRESELATRFDADLMADAPRERAIGYAFALRDVEERVLADKPAAVHTIIAALRNAPALPAVVRGGGREADLADLADLADCYSPSHSTGPAKDGGR